MQKTNRHDRKAIMDIYEEAAQRAWEAVLARVQELLAEGKKPAEISRMLGHKGRSAVTNWIAKKATAEKAEFPDMLRYIGVLGLNPLDFIPHAAAPTIRRIGPNAPLEAVEGDDLPKVPVMGDAGAGDEAELFEAVPDCFISVLPRYYRKDLITLKVTGDSMSPTISMGDYVGIIPFDGILHEGGIYLVDLPPFGRVVKRVRMGKTGEIILLSDNPSYGERVIPYEGYEKSVIGQVCWIMQKCWEF